MEGSGVLDEAYERSMNTDILIEILSPNEMKISPFQLYAMKKMEMIFIITSKVGCGEVGIEVLILVLVGAHCGDLSSLILVKRTLMPHERYNNVS
ncbi:hypothetical protein Syun_026050 [Stephania yunnanensis]|uniref:Uncharacterized protein n=1 Tax=Stephania yunnanensis TaxID=152371 RepID=A0AAP0EVG4_9MAGN